MKVIPTDKSINLGGKGGFYSLNCGRYSLM